MELSKIPQKGKMFAMGQLHFHQRLATIASRAGLRTIHHGPQNKKKKTERWLKCLSSLSPITAQTQTHRDKWKYYIKLNEGKWEIEKLTSIINSRIQFNNNRSPTNWFEEISWGLCSCWPFLSTSAHSAYLKSKFLYLTIEYQ